MLSFASYEHDVLCFQIRVNNIVAVDQSKSFCDFNNDS